METRNAFTVDLEDWFCSHNLSGAAPFAEWERLESHVERGTERLLGLLKKSGTKATFFVLGWVAERFPELIKSVIAEGHEIGSHGYSHRQITKMSPEEFEQDVRRSLGSLGGFGVPVRGFRAPAFSVTRRTAWAADVLQHLGFQYDTSVYPVGVHPDYGIPDAPLTTFRHPNGLLEIPMSVAEIGSFRVPCSGGGYLRQFPYPVFRSLARRCNAQGRPLIFYIHPWELVPEIPKVSLPVLKKFRHYNNLSSTAGKVERLLFDFEFFPVSEILKSREFGI